MDETSTNVNRDFFGNPAGYHTDESANCSCIRVGVKSARFSLLKIAFGMTQTLAPRSHSACLKKISIPILLENPSSSSAPAWLVHDQTQVGITYTRHKDIHIFCGRFGLPRNLPTVHVVEKRVSNLA
jgi:hypothetical protein